MSAPETSAATRQVYAICAFGEAHLGMLLSCVHSVRAAAPGSRIVLVWDDIEEACVRVFVERYGVEAHRFGAAPDDPRAAVRAASKMAWWRHAVSLVESPANVVLLDVDTLLVRDVAPYFDGTFGVGFTVHDGNYPINTGVALVSLRPETEAAVREFVDSWATATEEILRDPARLAVANSREHGYGAADQMALSLEVGYVRGVRDYRRETARGEALARAFPCDELNEIVSRPIGPKTAIIHYKAVWQGILLRGYNFGRRRTRAASWEMYVHYLRTYLAARERVAGTALTRRAKIFVPRYVGADWRPRPALEALHRVAAFFRRLADRARSRSSKMWRAKMGPKPGRA